jgi:serine phosphatase RsbU (regulator of sigma subunit)/anti-sigma regulatory factor (Ser/Thr protein kinase)
MLLVMADDPDLPPEPLVRDEHWLRDVVNEVTLRLNRAGTAQEIADAVGDVVRTEVGWFGVVLGLTDPLESVLQQYWCAPLRDMVSARYMRIPLRLDTPQTRAVRTAKPVFVAGAGELQEQFPGPFRAMSTDGLGPVGVLPLEAADGRMLGALALMWAEDLAFGPIDQALAEAVGEVTAQAVDRVHAAARERSVAVALQDAFLTLAMHSSEAVVGARYRSADTALQIGGDWYDAIVRPDGRLFVAVGDTVGSGLSAAATMGRLRSSAGVTALQTTDPARVLQYLDEYAAHVPGATMATVAIAVYEPRRRRIRYVCAGHPPPVLVKPTGDVELLWGARSWPLDVEVGRVRPAPATVAFPAGSMLLLYTDGLVERRDQSIDAGFDRLLASVRRNWTLPVPLLLPALLDELGIEDGHVHDDVAMIAVRSVGTTDRHYVDVFSAARDEVSSVRHRVLEWLEQVGVPDPPRADIVLAVNEVVANAIEHGSAFDPSMLVSVEASFRDPELIVSVSDRGRWRSDLERSDSERGRGLPIVERLSDDVRIETGAPGTTVTVRWPRATSV